LGLDNAINGHSERKVVGQIRFWFRPIVNLPYHVGDLQATSAFVVNTSAIVTFIAMDHACVQ
jgi:hypothetical protein